MTSGALNPLKNPTTPSSANVFRTAALNVGNVLGLDCIRTFIKSNGCPNSACIAPPHVPAISSERTRRKEEGEDRDCSASSDIREGWTDGRTVVNTNGEQDKLAPPCKAKEQTTKQKQKKQKEEIKRTREMKEKKQEKSKRSETKRNETKQ
jgi:hypothetical protein